MTSQSLRKHRITRWNIPATNNRKRRYGRTSSSGILCLTLCCVFLVSTATAQQGSAPVLNQASTVVAKPAGPTTPVPPVPTPQVSQALVQSRALLNGLRSSRNAATIPASPATPPKLQTNNILLTSDEDGIASFSSMSLVLDETAEGPLTPVPVPPTPNTDENASAANFSESANASASPHYSLRSGPQGQHGTAANVRKQRRKSRSFHDRITRWTAGMIEFYDPDFEEPYDTDDYEMKILLVSGEEESSDESKLLRCCRCS